MDKYSWVGEVTHLDKKKMNSNRFSNEQTNELNTFNSNLRYTCYNDKQTNFFVYYRYFTHNLCKFKGLIEERPRAC